MSFICKRCRNTFQAETETKSVCENCKTQLNLLKEELSVNNERIRKLEEHKKSELQDPKNPKTHLETMKRIEHNLQIEYKKRNGLTNLINSKDEF